MLKKGFIYLSLLLFTICFYWERAFQVLQPGNAELSRSVAAMPLRAKNQQDSLLYAHRHPAASTTALEQQPWWSYALFMLMAAAVVYAGIQLYFRRLRQENNRLERMIKDRTQQLLRKQEEIMQKSILLEEQKNEILAYSEELEQQQEEILAQRDYISEKNRELELQKNEVEKAYHDMKILSEIGQKITSVLDVGTVIHTVYQSVNMLMDASAFGIGVYQPASRRLTFQGFMEKGQELPLHYDCLDSDTTLAVWCFKNQQTIFINNLEAEALRYWEKPVTIVAGEVPESVIYVPLTIDERQIGVITVQSFKKNAYSDYHLFMLQSLASYISIGLDNANAYQLIEKKNQHITGSIRYAQTIQEAILPDPDDLLRAFASHFVIYKPKDVVSGDFYWFCEQNDMTFIAAIDCTGHGVAGAFMSMIGNTLLNEIVDHKQIFKPAAILEALHRGIRLSLRQEEQGNTDGMDVCLCRIENLPNGQKKITFAGARRPLYYIQAGQQHIEVIKGDRKAIGGDLFMDSLSFTNKEIILEAGSQLYLTTDGITDQNNPAREKLGWPRLARCLQACADQPMEVQQQQIEQLLNSYQQYVEQRDDITMLGIKL